MPNDQAVDIYNKICWGKLWPYDQEHCSSNSFLEIGPHFLAEFDLAVVVAEVEVAFVLAVDAVDLVEFVGPAVEDFVSTVAVAG